MKWLNSTNIYNFLCVYMPLLYIYKSPVPGVDWGTALVVLCIFIFYKGKRKNGTGMPLALIAILVYSIACTVINLASGTTYYSSFTSIVTRLGRFVVVMIVMMGLGFSNHFVPKKYLKFLRGLTLFVAGYAMLQAFVFRFTGVKLINVIGSINEDVAHAYALGNYDAMYRPPSIFVEPSHASYFMVPYLCYTLFCKPSQNRAINKNRFLEALIISLGILFTTSGQGLIVVAICWGIWALRSGAQLNFTSLIIFAGALIFLLYNFDFNATINRVITTDEMNAVEGRQGGYFLFEKLSEVSKFFGNGFGNYYEHLYFSSFAEILFCTGYFGLFLVLLLFIQPLWKGQFFQKVLAISSIVLMMGGGIYTASYLCLYLPLLVYKGWNDVFFEPKTLFRKKS